MNDLTTDSNLSEMTERVRSRPIDYLRLEEFNLGNYDPRKDPYYQSTAYDVTQRNAIQMPLPGEDDIGYYPKNNRIISAGFHAEDVISKRNSGLFIFTDTYLQREAHDKLNAFGIETKQDRLADKTLHQRIWITGMGTQMILGLLWSFSYLLSHWGSWLYIISAILAYLLGNDHSWQSALSYLGITICIWLVAFIIWKISSWLISKTDKYPWAYADRQTGMIVIPQKKGGNLEIPFKECEMRIKGYTRGTEVHHSLVLVTCQGKEIPLGEFYAIDSLIQGYYMEQFMDITKPLPDIPMLEQFRHLDPTTAAYDKMINRDPNYWRNKTAKEINEIADARRKKIASDVGRDAFRM